MMISLDQLGMFVFFWLPLTTAFVLGMFEGWKDGRKGKGYGKRT